MTDDETPRDRLNRLADQSGRQAGELERLTREDTGQRARIEALEGQVAALRAAHEDLATRLERSVAQHGGEGHLQALDERLTAAHAAGLRTAERVEAVAADVAALGRMASALEQTRADLAHQLAVHADDTQRAIAEAEARARGETDALKRLVAEREARVEALAAALDRIEALERGRRELGDGLHRLDARLDDEAAARTAVAEALRAAEERGAQRVADVRASLSALAAAVEAARARDEEHMGVLRDGRNLADAARREAERLNAAQVSSERAREAAEARIDGQLTSWRRDIDEAFDAFVTRHDREREQAERAHVAREDQRDEAQAERLAALAARLDGIARDTDARLAAVVDEFGGMRRLLAEWLARERDGAQALAAALERDGQSEAAPALAEERRAALRRAMRARRDASGGGA